MAKAASERRFWLFKSEPDVFSFRDLLAEKGKRTYWNGVRNYQARNLLRDEIAVGDGVLFYHSNTDPLAVVGTCKVVKAGYPDHTAFDARSKYHDPESEPGKPTWFMVDIEAVAEFDEPVTRARLQQDERLAGMMLLQRGARLSVQPVTRVQWECILELGGVKERGR
ncbi:MAG: EVE domain-containing protein [Planctomycetota bacterium]